MSKLPEDADERRMFEAAARMLGITGLRQVAFALTVWHRGAPEQGSYGKVLAIYANECAAAAEELERLSAALAKAKLP